MDTKRNLRQDCVCFICHRLAPAIAVPPRTARRFQHELSQVQSFASSTAAALDFRPVNTASPVVPKGPPLDNNANNSSPPPLRSSDQRERRYFHRGVQWDVTELPRIRKCGRVRITDSVGVRHSAALGAGFSGLSSCGSVWSCPVCSAKIMARRALEIGVALLAWENRGGQVAFGTFTMWHHKGMRLADVWAAIGKSWATLTSGKAWKSWAKRLGLVGVIKVVEVNYGPNGWHVHIHAVYLVGGGVSQDRLNEFREWAYAKWARALERAGYPGALDLGQDLEFLDSLVAIERVSEYISKATPCMRPARKIGLELTGQQTKKARFAHSTYPAWQLLEEFAVSYDADTLDLWHEYERASKGKQQISWSKGLRELLHVGQELSDEDIAAEDHGDSDLLFITAAGWQTVMTFRPHQIQILHAAEQGPAHLRSYLKTHQIEFKEVGE